MRAAKIVMEALTVLFIICAISAMCDFIKGIILWDAFVARGALFGALAGVLCVLIERCEHEEA